MVQPGWIEAAAAVAALIVAILAALYAIREHRNAREAFVQEMRLRWGELSRKWARILLAEYGPDFHYADATSEERASAAVTFEALRDNSGVEPGYSAALALRMDVRPITRFIAYAADSVLSGRWRVSEAYDVLGPDVARHHKTLRLLAHRRADTQDWLIQATEFNMFDEQDCVYLFAFLLRAEQCRRGDTHGHFIVELAEEMRGSDKGALAVASRRARRVRRRMVLPRGVRKLFRQGRRPNVRSAYGIPESPIISGTQRLLFRRPLEPLVVLRLRIWWTHQRFGPSGSSMRSSIGTLVCLAARRFAWWIRQ